MLSKRTFLHFSVKHGVLFHFHSAHITNSDCITGNHYIVDNIQHFIEVFSGISNKSPVIFGAHTCQTCVYIKRGSITLSTGYQ